MPMDALILARIQFAANISFHILFPTITIALGWVLLYFKVRYLRSRDESWMHAYRFWVKVFALSFGLGVVSGITMSFQFGTNWPGYMETVGNIAGPLLAYEVMTAFFLEAAFLGIMLFGHGRVSNFVHTLATALVAIGTTLSAFTILILNSWMQTPAGFEMRDGVAHATSWLEIIFNPSMPYRFTHMLLASVLTVSFLIAGLSALRWLIGDRATSMWIGLRTGVYLAAAIIPVQIFVGDLHCLHTYEHQPQKVAAIEGHWETGGNVPLLLFAIPDEGARANRFEIGIPNGASLLLTHTLHGEIVGLNEFVAEDGTALHPPVAPVFFAFRVMVGIGSLMLVVSWAMAWRLWRRGDPGLWGARVLSGMAFSGWVATLAGWYVTEIGRQPWLVSDVLFTADAVADHPAAVVGMSLGAYLAVYAALVLAYLAALTYLARSAAQSSDEEGPEPDLAGAVAAR
ncbi:cytochrome ubiquinol oxidase subunit I [soil metagenome]